MPKLKHDVTQGLVEEDIRGAARVVLRGIEFRDPSLDKTQGLLMVEHAFHSLKAVSRDRPLLADKSLRCHRLNAPSQELIRGRSTWPGGKSCPARSLRNQGTPSSPECPFRGVRSCLLPPWAAAFPRRNDFAVRQLSHFASPRRPPSLLERIPRWVAKGKT